MERDMASNNVTRFFCKQFQSSQINIGENVLGNLYCDFLLSIIDSSFWLKWKKITMEISKRAIRIFRNFCGSFFMLFACQHFNVSHFYLKINLDGLTHIKLWFIMKIISLMTHYRRSKDINLIIKKHLGSD